MQTMNLGVAAMGLPTRNPPQHPLDAQTLMLHRQEANSRFLTDCYLFPAALRSGTCPKLGRRALVTQPQTGSGAANRATGHDAVSTRSLAKTIT